MLEELLMHLHNWFVKDIYNGSFSIEEGAITLPFLAENQYYRIIGSTFNDGLHKYVSTEELTDESFCGTIWALAIPNMVINIADEIESWRQSNDTQANSPYTSESFGGYSYQKATLNGKPINWQNVFAHRLNHWRKI